ncbi:hypothetical protein ACJJTC_014225 [Scirpophaga incertulas]
MSGFTWSNENVITLIELFQERQVLWNPQMDEYKDRNKKHDAWMQIAAEFNLDKQAIEKKMRSLIGQFQRECKKPKSGAGADDIPKWFAYKKLLFLKDRNKPEETVDGGLSVNETQSEKQISDTNTDSGVPTEKPFTALKTFRKRFRPQVTEDKTSEEALKLLKEMYESRRERDETDIFGEYVAKKLKEIKNTHARNTAQYHINNILFSASTGEYDWPTNTMERPSNAAGAFGYNSVPSPSTSSVDISTDSREYINTPSPSTLLDKTSITNVPQFSEDSTQSFHDLLQSIQNK